MEERDQEEKAALLLCCSALGPGQQKTVTCHHPPSHTHTYTFFFLFWVAIVPFSELGPELQAIVMTNKKKERKKKSDSHFDLGLCI